MRRLDPERQCERLRNNARHGGSDHRRELAELLLHLRGRNLQGNVVVGVVADLEPETDEVADDLVRVAQSERIPVDVQRGDGGKVGVRLGEVEQHADGAVRRDLPCRRVVHLSRRRVIEGQHNWRLPRGHVAQISARDLQCRHGVVALPVQTLELRGEVRRRHVVLAVDLRDQPVMHEHRDDAYLVGVHGGRIRRRGRWCRGRRR